MARASLVATDLSDLIDRCARSCEAAGCETDLDVLAHVLKLAGFDRPETDLFGGLLCLIVNHCADEIRASFAKMEASQ